MSTEKSFQILTMLGLTHSQAKVYSALASLGEARVGIIWKSSGVHRQDIYRILSELQNLGLIEKIVAKPTKFRAVPIEVATSFLIDGKENELLNFKKNANKLISTLISSNEKKEIEENEDDFVLIPKGRKIQHYRICQVLKEVQSSIDVVCTYRSLLQYLHVYSGEHSEELKRRGVKVRIIVEKPENQESLFEIHRLLSHMKFPTQLKFTPTPLPVTFALNDEKKLLLNILKNGGILESPKLFSTNPCIIALAKAWFEKMWKEKKINRRRSQARD